ncbi:hypothetical protein PENARI_c004G09108 [Penicillium arizonense]|uniref:Anaphase-promoting complex subunit 4 WD40 domain-containing protein n=1 Tax=Penicillium arizonense TaxID=1835702 RepID=A0A1F5LQM4_PENAI|nr:hypothetical protein PENARI_c004G09108 [Penicillium arizonense]OGE55503.1 hypothetical protein PENARI_c004G09108 [Penicillium arizonense]
MINDDSKPWTPVCVASTEPQLETGPFPNSSPPFLRSISASIKSEPEDDYKAASLDPACNFYKSAEWPPDLLENKQVHQLSPYSTLPSAEPTYSTAIYPFYNLSDPSTTLFLSSVRDHPIRLSSALAPTNMASYSLVNPMTEAYITPHSMIYPSVLGGTHFLTGSDSLISLFDISRSGNEGPISSIPTIPSKRKQIVGGGIGMKGIVSALAVNPSGDGVLAAGTFTRNIGLYSSNGSGESLGTFSIAKTEANRDIGGRGVTQLVWSPCGRYLYIAERKSDGVLVYDIRVLGQMLGHLRGRKAFTNQRMRIDVVPSGPDGSHEVWAGGTDGFMRVWRDPIFSAGGKDPDWQFRVHEDAVTSTVLHPMGNVVATCSGQRHYDHDYCSADEDSPVTNARNVDNSLKVWSMPFLNSESDVDHELDDREYSERESSHQDESRF